MSFKLGGIILEDLVLLSPEEKKFLADMGRPAPAAKREIGLAEKMILLAFAAFADDRGRNIYPSRKRVARMAGGCSVRTVERAVEKFLADQVLVYDEPVDKAGRAIRRRTRCYRIDVAKAVDLYAEALPKEDTMSHVKEDMESPVEKPNEDKPVGKEDMVSSNVGHGVTESCHESRHESLARAREAGAAPEGAPASPPDAGHALQEAISVFKEKLPAIRAEMGEEGWKLYGASLFAIGHSPGHMLLGQPSPWLRDMTLDHYRDALERATGCKVEIVNRWRPAPGELSKKWKERMA